MEQLTVLIGGDLSPTESNYLYFNQGSIQSLFDDKLIALLNSADYRFFNLETPLTDKKTPISKDGPTLMSPESVINGLKTLNPLILGLANNHILDQSEQGLLRTMELLSAEKIAFTGAGKDINYAASPFILEKSGFKLGIYACAENEFSIAEENKAGANPFDPLESLDHIKTLKSECDFVIVLHHGGTEFYRYPSPELQKVCRKMTEKGADLVICQHSHCIGSYEKYHDGTIVYGQGNFLFDRNDNEFWDTGLLIKVTLGENMSVDFVPISKIGNGVRLSPPEIREEILKAFYLRSAEISNPGFIRKEFEKYCIENGQYYLATVAGMGKTLRRTDKVLKGIITRLIYSRDKLNILQNNIKCEAHRELILKYLQLLRKTKQ